MITNWPYKKGDITSAGWEVISVNYTYGMRKRIKITTDRFNLNGIFGFYYFDNGFKWIETDAGKTFKLRENEFEFID